MARETATDETAQNRNHLRRWQKELPRRTQGAPAPRAHGRLRGVHHQGGRRAPAPARRGGRAGERVPAHRGPRADHLGRRARHRPHALRRGAASRCSPTNPKRETAEMAACRGAMSRDMPVLGICGGMQVINIAAGGTLYQDIPSQVPARSRTGPRTRTRTPTRSTR